LSEKDSGSNSSGATQVYLRQIANKFNQILELVK